ncbi:hypothetical protein GGQ64_005330 [Rhizobium azooxidifex]|uniref:Uncharacterized protein n=1 Tax=Mycoplana azooxidifex TaxID=1636188 RepID=A0A7W6DHS9_9HYPH|nr:hypothetical protein [Mycoplana azooxidifex]MBB3980083.1 hypothetical protein [Mycoplana azooxidifex]
MSKDVFDQIAEGLQAASEVSKTDPFGQAFDTVTQAQKLIAAFNERVAPVLSPEQRIRAALHAGTASYDALESMLLSLALRSSERKAADVVEFCGMRLVRSKYEDDTIRIVYPDKAGKDTAFFMVRWSAR